MVLSDPESSYRSIYEAFSDPLFLIDSEDLSVLEANPAAVAVLDRGDGMLTSSILENVAAGDRELVAATLKRIGQSGSAPRILARLGKLADSYLLHACLLEEGKAGLLLVHLMPCAEIPIEVTAALKSNHSQAYFALNLHDAGRRLEASNRSGLVLPEFLGGLAGRLGEASLKEVVSSAVGLVERYYIEAALEAVDGNRTAAARILGISRQGFYDKLSRYRMDGHAVQPKRLAEAEMNS